MPQYARPRAPPLHDLFLTAVDLTFRPVQGEPLDKLAAASSSLFPF